MYAYRSNLTFSVSWRLRKQLISWIIRSISGVILLTRAILARCSIFLLKLSERCKFSIWICSSTCSKLSSCCNLIFFSRSCHSSKGAKSRSIENFLSLLTRILSKKIKRSITITIMKTTAPIMKFNVDADLLSWSARASS